MRRRPRYRAVSIALLTLVALAALWNAISKIHRHRPPVGAAAAGDAEGVLRGATRSEETGQLASDSILESSGLAPAFAALGMGTNRLWTHNDSGDAPRLYLISTAGTLLATVDVDGAEAIDWEDMCRFTWRRKNWLLIADVGDNLRQRESCSLYLLEEPKVEVATENAPSIAATVAQRIDFTYVDGPRDCESIAVIAGESESAPAKIYLLSKETRGRLYEIEIPEAAGAAPLKATFVAETTVPMATSLSISPDERRAVALTYGDAYEFTRAEGESWAAAFAKTFRVLEMPERRQGEAICFGASSDELWLTSEGAEQPIWRVEIL